MDEETLEQKGRLLAIYQDNLRVLEVQSALYGMNPPLHLINQINHHRQQIEQLHLILGSNAQGVSLDTLLLSIADLQSYVREEARKALVNYQDLLRAAKARDTAWILGMVVSGFAIGIGMSIYQKIKTGELPDKIVLHPMAATLLYGVPTGVKLLADYQYKQQWRKKFEERFGFPPDSTLRPL